MPAASSPVAAASPSSGALAGEGAAARQHCRGAAGRLQGLGLPPPPSSSAPSISRSPSLCAGEALLAARAEPRGPLPSGVLHARTSPSRSPSALPAPRRRGGTSGSSGGGSSQDAAAEGGRERRAREGGRPPRLQPPPSGAETGHEGATPCPPRRPLSRALSLAPPPPDEARAGGSTTRPRGCQRGRAATWPSGLDALSPARATASSPGDRPPSVPLPAPRRSRAGLAGGGGVAAPGDGLAGLRAPRVASCWASLGSWPDSAGRPEARGGGESSDPAACHSPGGRPVSTQLVALLFPLRNEGRSAARSGCSSARGCAPVPAPGSGSCAPTGP